ncbi:uncharacterized protein LOC141601467 [Silene latifolia]|uniref:uncharacterized protein LOC141601467 n=1 Tax=Silene latifolia TaxID=37657 RepID=UPI003D77EA4B
MGNQAWQDLFGDYIAHFHPEGIFDHCPCTIVNRKADFGGRRSFKYFNMWGQSDQFLGSVQSVWSKYYPGTPMFTIVKKLKMLKPVLKQLNKHCFSDIENSTNITSDLLVHIQKQLVDNPGNLDLMQQEMEIHQDLKELIKARDSFLTQKAKLQWSLEGDINTSYFHRAIKKRAMLNKVLMIEDINGVICTEGSQIQEAFLSYYKDLLGTSHETIDVNVKLVQRGKCCTQEHCDILSRPVTDTEIRKCILSIPKDKSPGPDGYTSQFYKDAWAVVGSDICHAVKDFFEHGKMLQQINSTSNSYSQN